jgi:MYXO-CTERM domain-containing protein
MRRWSAVPLASLLLGACQMNDTTAGSTEIVGLTSVQQPIVDGTTSASGAHPATVFLWLGGGLCTGTLIAPRVVLTANHCLQGVSAVEVYFGNDPQSSSGTWIPSVNLRRHPATDIAVIGLARDAPTEPIALYRDPITPADVGRQTLIVGFGETGGAGAAGIKREGVTPIHSLQSDVVFVGQTGSKTCYGDSGGPTFLDDRGERFLIGVTSFGTSQDCNTGLSGQIRADLHTSWIESYLSEFADPTCGRDNQCAQGCDGPDPDCPCAADGFCSALCKNFLTEDPDCVGCAADGVCRTDCPVPDIDCCGIADGYCAPGCEGGDPDCADLGDRCAVDEDCNSLICATRGKKSRCSQQCSTDEDCPGGFECIGETACWPTGGCAAAGGGGAPGGALVLLALLAALSRRPGRRA